jgi:hypothetical protein
MQRQVLALRWSETRPGTAVGESQRRCGRVPAQCWSADVSHPFPYVVRRISCGRHSALALAHGAPRCTALRRSSRATRCCDRGRLRLSRGAHAARTRHARAPEAESGLSHRAIVTVPRLFGSRYSCASNRPGRAASQDAALRARCCNASQGGAATHRKTLRGVATRCKTLLGAPTHRKIFARCCNESQHNRAVLQRIAT